MYRLWISFWGLLSLVLVIGCQTTTPINESGPAVSASRASEVPVNEVDFVQDVKIVLRTSKGPISAKLYATKTPITVANFLNLAKRGYYDGLLFHRVIDNFMIQGGDPTGTGRGGPGYRFEDEFHSALSHNRSGIFSMANSGPGTNGSQFFITHRATMWLDRKHTVFGKVLEGQGVVNRIEQGDQILGIEILGATDALFEQEAGRIAVWNEVLDAKGI